jgi:hypothetical protein
MIFGTIVLILSIVVLIIGGSVLFWPLEYVSDALVDNYPVGPLTGDGSEISGTMGMFVYFLLVSLVTGIVLLFVWFFGYAHKFEYEQD